jgi:hypothetical protein
MPEPDETIITNKVKAKRLENAALKEKPKGKKRPEPAKAKPEIAKPKAATPEPAKSEPAKSEPAKSKAAKPEPAKAEPAKAETAKPETAKFEPAKPEPAKPEPAKAMPPKSVVVAKIAALEKGVKRLQKLSLLLFLIILGLGIFGVNALKGRKTVTDSVTVPTSEDGELLSNPFYSSDESGEMKKLLKEVRAELEQQKIRNRLTKFADEAISTGSRYAFRELERHIDNPDNSVTKDACNAEIIRVESHYITARRYRSYSVPMAKLFPGKKESELTFDDLVQLLSSASSHWEFRAWAARQMGDMPGNADVPEALVRAMKGESDLCVVQEALRSFEKLTGYQPPGVFDTTVAVDWWNENKERYAKTGRVPAQ